MNRIHHRMILMVAGLLVATFSTSCVTTVRPIGHGYHRHHGHHKTVIIKKKKHRHYGAPVRKRVIIRR